MHYGHSSCSQAARRDRRDNFIATGGEPSDIQLVGSHLTGGLDLGNKRQRSRRLVDFVDPRRAEKRAPGVAKIPLESGSWLLEVARIMWLEGVFEAHWLTAARRALVVY